MRYLVLAIVLCGCDSGNYTPVPPTPVQLFRSSPDTITFAGEFQSADMEVFADKSLLTEDYWYGITPSQFGFFGPIGALDGRDVTMHAFRPRQDLSGTITVDLVDQKLRGQTFTLCLSVMSMPYCARPTLFQ